MVNRQTIRTRDGWELAASLFLPDTAFHTVLIIGADMGQPQSSYFNFARFFRDKGSAVLTFDYRGTGHSRLSRKSEEKISLHQWAVFDLDAVLLLAKNQFPGCELVFLGHGVSGQLVGLAPASLFIDRLLFINCALNARQLLPWPGRWRMTLWWVAHGFRRFLPAIFFSRNIPHSLLGEWLNLTRRPNGLFDLFPSNNFRQMDRPLLALTFSDDWRATPRAVQALLSQFPAASVTSFRLSPSQLGVRRMGQSGFFRIPAMHPLWDWLYRWIGQQESDIPYKNSAFPG